MFKKIRAVGTLSVFALLSACGGGGGGAIVPGVSDVSISGVAATGAAISGGLVEAKCAVGTGSVTSNTDGTFTVAVSNATLPCILRATDPITKTQLHSIVEAGSTKANITPVTELVVANTLGNDPATSFSNFSADVQSKITPTNITSAVTRVQSVTAVLGTDSDLTGVDFMKGAMTAATADGSGDSTDKKIDALMAALSASDKKISDLSAQVKSMTNASNASTITTSVVGDAQYALANCPYARSGDFWLFDFIGTAPAAWNVNFNTMVLKKLSNNTTYSINLKRDASNTPIACAFTSSINNQTVEYRVSPGGVAVWVNTSDFGLTIPAQKTNALTDASFAGTYPAMGFIKGKTNSLRLGIPFKFEINADGTVDAYSCDMTKAVPDCTTATADSKDPMTCTAMSNGTFNCVSVAGTTVTAVLYVTGSQATMLMAVTNMTLNSAAYGGLIALTKAADLKLPLVGKTASADVAWEAGVAAGSNAVYSRGSPAMKVDSVSSSTNSVVVSYTDYGSTSTSYLNTPANGFIYDVNNGSKSIGMGSAAGWSIGMTRSPTGSYYDGWSAAVKTKN